MMGPMEEKDLYAALGVARGASNEEIRAAYRKLARKYHPDVNPGDAKAEEHFKEVAFAYDVLSDPDKRSRYDEFGVQGLAPGFDPEQARSWKRWSEGAQRSPFHESFEADFDLEDLLSHLGGLGGAGRRGAGAWRTMPLRGRDAHAEVEVDFLDAAMAREVRLQLAGRETLRVRIPPGAEDGTRVRLAGKGEPGAESGPPGDLYVSLRVRPHPFFRREGADLHVQVPVTIPELVLGASIEVPTPEGPVAMKVPPRSRPGQRLRLRGKGARRPGKPDRGDLYVELEATLPEGDDARLEELARQMEGLYAGSDPRARLRSSS
jgi:curved DNA-binding protein